MDSTIPWPNAPLVATVMQLQFAFMGLEDLPMERVRTRFAELGFSSFLPQRQQTTSITIGSEGQNISNQFQDVFVFNNLENDARFVLAAEALTYLTTRNQRTTKTLEELLDGVELLANLQPDRKMLRVGVRYVDAIQPTEQENLSKYFEVEPIGMHPKIGNNKHIFSQNQALYLDDQVHTSVKILIHSNPVLSIPEDLNINPLRIDPRFLKPYTGLRALSDIDAFELFLKPQGIAKRDTLKGLFQRSTNQAKTAFQSIFSQDAREVWQRPLL